MRDGDARPDAHPGMDPFRDSSAADPGDPVLDVLDELRRELAASPDEVTRATHLAAISASLPTPSGGALRSHRMRIHHALAAAALKVAVISTAAAAATGGLAAADALPSPVQRLVADAAATIGLDLPSPPPDALVPAVVEDSPTEAPVTSAPEPPQMPQDPEPRPGNVVTLDRSEPDDEPTTTTGGTNHGGATAVPRGSGGGDTVPEADVVAPEPDDGADEDERGEGTREADEDAHERGEDADEQGEGAREADEDADERGEGAREADEDADEPDEDG